MKKIKLITYLMCVSIAFFYSAFINAQTYPNQPIKLVVPFAPGGSTDLTARLVAEYAGRELDKQIIIENRAGAGGSIGMEYVARSKPDGYTLGMATMSTHGANSAVYKGKLKYDPIKDFSPITNIAATPSVLAVHPKVPAKTFQQFVTLAEVNPMKYSYASPGTGSLGHANVEYMATLTKIKLLHVPYKGAGLALNDVLAGQVDVITDNLPTALPHIKGGRLRALVILSDKRSSALPDVPTYAELGFPEMGGGGWFGVVAPIGVSQSIIMTLNKAINQAMKNPEFIKKLEESGATAVPGTPAEFAKQIQQAIDRFQTIAKVAQIQIE